jgi:hemolysin III
MTFNKDKDLVSAYLHILGLLLSVAGTVVLLVKGAALTPWHVVSYAIFGATLIALYAASSTYHLFYISEKVHNTLRRIDHIMIFMLIAGTYTPICLVTLQGAWGWVLFGIVWGCALAGLLIKIFWMDAPRWLSTVFYIAMGWAALIAIWPLTQRLAPQALLWLFGGGVVYTIGGVFYALKYPRIDARYFGFHELFHIFILLGSACFYVLIYCYIV